MPQLLRVSKNDNWHWNFQHHNFLGFIKTSSFKKRTILCEVLEVASMYCLIHNRKTRNKAIWKQLSERKKNLRKKVVKQVSFRGSYQNQQSNYNKSILLLQLTAVLSHLWKHYQPSKVEDKIKLFRFYNFFDFHYNIKTWECSCLWLLKYTKYRKESCAKANAK